ncbi:hypothetical protein [Brevundimonas sp.]|uniref:LuxR C-terminal-related transcriptional regulator n=1 Tax=Brevundimonas sp. TaxID=1871086 RepID=UPI001A2BAD23|nr:hypothetical protein [Brevundimonas sp.]MBJ7485193.1 hypothetical protein [Brevundimonas sp.]
MSAKGDYETVALALALAGALGASGFGDRASGLGAIVQSLGRIMGGVFVFPQGGPAVHQASLVAADAIAVITSAPLRVMIAVADGRSSKQIAHDLGLSEATMRASRSENGRPGLGYDFTDQKKAL